MPEQKYMNDKLSQMESISSAMLALIGIFTVLRGTNWIVFNDNTRDYELYESLITVASLSVWGSVFVIGGGLLMLSSWFLPRRNTRKRFALTMGAGGLIMSINYFIVAIAGFNNSATWLVPSQMITLSVIGGVLAFFGGMQLWQMRTTKSM